MVEGAQSNDRPALPLIKPEGRFSHIRLSQSDEETLLRLITAFLVETSEERETGTIYFNMEPQPSPQFEFAEFTDLRIAPPLRPEHGVQEVNGQQPFGVGEALRPDHHRHQKVVSERVSGMGMLELGSAKGRCRCTCPANPIELRKEMKRTRQPKCEMALGVSSRTSLASPESEAISMRVVLFGVGLDCLSINPYAHSPLVKVTPFLIRSSS